MTEKEFCIWLSGFVESAHTYSITPQQWTTLKETLAQVRQESNSPVNYLDNLNNWTVNFA